jgi:WD40 repeat protein
VQSVAFSPDGSTIASGSFDKTVRLWEVSSGRALRAFEGHTNGVRSVAFSPDGSTIASGSSDNTVRLWEVSSGCALRFLRGHRSAITGVAFHPDGRTLASASEDGTVRLWNVASGACLAVLLALPEGWAAFTPDGRYKIGGDIAGGFWHVAGLCRFEPGELDPYLTLSIICPSAIGAETPDGPGELRAAGGPDGRVEATKLHPSGARCGGGGRAHAGGD